MSTRFKAVDRETPYLLPPSVQDWLPEDHLARFVVEVVSKLDLHELKMPYTGVGSEPYNPEMLLSMLFYGYATGVFSSRKLEQASHDSLAFRFIAANTHPDHDTIANFRKRFLKQLEPLFVQILLLAKVMGFLKLGKISLDGSKIQANASKHSALSWGHAVELERQLKEEVARLMAMAEAADAAVPEGMDIPKELKLRDARLAAIAQAKAKLEARAAERFAAEQAEYEARQAKREAARAEGKSPKGPGPKPPEPGVRHNDQMNLTDEESRVMPSSGGKNFQQAYNVQAGVDTETMLVVTAHVTPHANDKLEVEPTLKALEQLPDTLGKVEALLGDTGYRSERNTKLCEETRITPYIAGSQESHHPSVEQRYIQPPPLAGNADVVQAMDHRLATLEGRAIYALRKSTVEPVFGIIKSVLGFRQFHLRGLEAASGEWTLVTMAWNLKRLFNLKSAADRTTRRRVQKSAVLSPECSNPEVGKANSATNGSPLNDFFSFLASLSDVCDFEPYATGLTPTGS
jgi:Transposase and inactivated derivatives